MIELAEEMRHGESRNFKELLVERVTGVWTEELKRRRLTSKSA
jgi:hypothetical protein